MNEQHPSLEIRRIRRREEKKKKIIRFVLSLIAYILVFCIGFCSGILFPSDVSVKDVFVKNDRIAGSAAEGNKAPSTTPEKEIPKPKSTEEQKLDELGKRFISYVKEKYPTVDLSFAIKNLDTGASHVYDDKKMNSASVIKLFIMEAVFDEIEAGNLEPLTAEEEKELKLMITQSKNEAANLFIDKFEYDETIRKVPGDGTINSNIKKHGYVNTELNRKMFDKTPPGGPTGFENYTSVTEACDLLESIYNGTRFSKENNQKAMDYLFSQERRTKIPSKIVQKYSDVKVGNKTGELSQVENDVALILSDDFKLTFAVFISNIPKTASGATDYKLKEEIQAVIGDLGLMLVDFYKNNKF